MIGSWFTTCVFPLHIFFFLGTTNVKQEETTFLATITRKPVAEAGLLTIIGVRS